MTDFSPGLAGVVAFETEIAEPDKEGGELRYRGVDIEELVGAVPFEQVWGLLVDESLHPGLPAAYVELELRTGGYMADLQSALASFSGKWKLGQLIDIDDEQAKEDLRRLSAAALSIVAQSARGADLPPVPQETVLEGQTAAERFLLAWRGEVDEKSREGDRHVLDLHGRARPQRIDLHRAHRRVDRRRLRRRALVGRRRALRSAARRRAGARAADARRGRGAGRRGEVGERGARAQGADHGLRPPRLPRRGSALAHAQAAPRKSSARRASRSPRSSSRPRTRRSRRRTRTTRGRTSSSGRRSCSTSRTCRRRSRPRCSRARAPPAGRRTCSSRSGSACSSARARSTSGRARGACTQ